MRASLAASGGLLAVLALGGCGAFKNPIESLLAQFHDPHPPAPGRPALTPYLTDGPEPLVAGKPFWIEGSFPGWQSAPPGSIPATVSLLIQASDDSTAPKVQLAVVPVSSGSFSYESVLKPLYSGPGVEINTQSPAPGTAFMFDASGATWWSGHSIEVQASPAT